MAWNGDASKFERPAGVEFMDMSAMMQGAMGGGMGGAAGTLPEGATMDDIKGTQCAACASLTGDAQAQCLAALGC